MADASSHPLDGLGRAAAQGAALALAGNVALWGLGNALIPGGLQLNAPPDGKLAALPLPAVMGATGMAAVVAAFLFAALHRFRGARARTSFLSVAGVFLLLSLSGPLGLPETTGIATKAVLCLMHLLAAASIAGNLARLGRD